MGGKVGRASVFSSGQLLLLQPSTDPATASQSTNQPSQFSSPRVLKKLWDPLRVLRLQSWACGGGGRLVFHVGPHRRIQKAAVDLHAAAKYSRPIQQRRAAPRLTAYGCENALQCRRQRCSACGTATRPACSGQTPPAPSPPRSCVGFVWGWQATTRVGKRAIGCRSCCRKPGRSCIDRATYSHYEEGPFEHREQLGDGYVRHFAAALRAEGGVLATPLQRSQRRAAALPPPALYGLDHGSGMQVVSCGHMEMNARPAHEELGQCQISGAICALLPNIIGVDACDMILRSLETGAGRQELQEQHKKEVEAAAACLLYLPRFSALLHKRGHQKSSAEPYRTRSTTTQISGQRCPHRPEHNKPCGQASSEPQRSTYDQSS